MDIFRVEVTDKDYASRVTFLGKAANMSEAIKKALALAAKRESMSKPIANEAELVGKLDF